jgi:hypothetical protein
MRAQEARDGAKYIRIIIDYVDNSLCGLRWPHSKTPALGVREDSAMVLRLRGTTAVPQLFVDCRQQLRFVKRLDNARIVADCSYPFGGIRFRMGSNKQTWNSDAIMHQPVPQGKAIYHLNRVAAMNWQRR